jgi:hypothetical protein
MTKRLKTTKRNRLTFFWVGLGEKGSPISVSGQEGKWISGSQPFFH